jgi:hypothetical protein
MNMVNAKSLLSYLLCSNQIARLKKYARKGNLTIDFGATNKIRTANSAHPSAHFFALFWLAPKDHCGISISCLF